MKIGIVIPLKAKVVSKNWDIVEAALQKTLNSVLKQTSSSFQVAVIGHDCPDFLKDMEHNQKKIFIQFNELAPPIIIADDEVNNQLRYEVDRCSKILKGIIILDKFDGAISHWFALDADDLLHNTFIETIVGIGDYDAFIIEKGYFYFTRWNIFNINDEFSAYCGSSAVLSTRLFKLPEMIASSITHRDIPFGNTSHVYMKKFLDDKGYSVCVPDKRLVTYVRDNGDNISDGNLNSLYKRTRKFIAMLVRAKFISKMDRVKLAIID